eukprot:g22414.t3
MVLCIFSNWIARIPQVWEGCVVGASLSVLHASFCSEPGPSRNELFQQVVDGVSLQGWSGQSVQVDWPIFDLVGAHAAVLSSGLWEGRGDQCSKLEPGDDDLGKASLITMHHALRASMITALLRSPWPLARLLGRLRPKAPDTENPGAAPGGLRGLQWMPLDEEQLPYTPSGSGAQIYEQSNDVTFPWVQFIARAVPPQGLFMGLPWPQGLRFTDIQREAMQLLEAFPASNYPSPSNDRQTWRTLCLVCKDGLQDPATTTEGTVYAKTEILSLAPALEKFIDLFGPTGDGGPGLYPEATQVVGEMPNCDGPVARNRGWITAGQSGTGARKKEDSLEKDVHLTRASHERSRAARAAARVLRPVQERQLQWPEERCLQLDEMLKTLAELGYYHPEDEFWHHAVAKFWFANSLGTVPVYPSWLLHDAVAMVLAPDAKRWTPRGARRWAFVLPRVDSEGPGLKAWKYASRLDAEVARAGIGPFMLEDSEDLAEEVLRRLGYLDPGEDSEIRSFLCQEGYLEATTVPEEAVFQAMQSYAKEKRLPAKRSKIGYTSMLIARVLRPRSRVRLSVVLPDGMIAWHPDARVVENGRLILHVPIQTNPRALTRVGQLLLHVPEGQLHWADFSIPHCVFNAGTQPRVHLIIDDFARNFLAHLPTAEAERFRRHALPEVALGEASAVGPPGTRFARPLSRQMSDTFGMLVGAEMLSLERRIWEQDLRIRSDTDWLRVLDGARALALLWTFALHSLLLETWDVESQKRRDLEETWDVMKRQWWAQLPLQGNTGVDAFFVLSGCLMTRSYEKLRKASKQPLWRRYAVFLLCRFFRLWPMVCVAVMASLLMGLLPCCAWSARWHSIWAHLLLVQNLDVESLKNPDLTVLWSIGTEMQIYLITPALLELLLRPTGQRRIWAFFALGCISILSTVFRFWLVFGSPDNPIERTWPPRPIYANPLSRLSPYLSGIALQLAFAERSLAPNATTVIASADSTASRAAEIPRAAMASAAVFSDVAALGVLLLSLLLGQKPEAAPSFMFDHFSQVVVKLIAILFPPIYGWALARVLFRCLTTPRGRSLPWSALQLFLASKIWRCLATLSYSAYVMQQFAVQPLARLMKELDLQWTADTSVSEAIWRYPVVLLLWTLMSCLIALPCHVIIEKPGIRLGRILSQRALGDGGAPWRPHSEGVPRAREVGNDEA